MDNPHKILTDLQPQHAFFIGIDSDGCVFDTMEIKQRQCFLPNTLKHWQLDAIAEPVWEATAFVNLYSKFRGMNRFPALVMVMDVLREHPAVLASRTRIPDLTSLADWCKQESKLGNPALKAYLETHHVPILATAYRWSEAINAAIRERVSGIPPFPHVREALEAISARADAIVVSQTPGEALEREWAEHGLERYARLIAGQEYGTKAQHLRYAAVGKYPADRILMIGDALGDVQAAQSNGVLFYPINPGREAASWERFCAEALDKFFTGAYAGDYEQTLIDEFYNYLPSTPPWRNT